MKFWITSCDDNSRVVFNVTEEFANLGAALAHAVANIPVQWHKNIVITDTDNNNLFPCDVPEGAKLCAYVGQWNKRKQCFPVRVTVGSQNLQWMNDSERALVSVHYREDFTHSAQAKAWAESIGAEVFPGWD